MSLCYQTLLARGAEGLHFSAFHLINLMISEANWFIDDCDNVLVIE